MVSRNALVLACMFAVVGAGLTAAPQPQQPTAKKPVAVAKTPAVVDMRPDLVVVSITYSDFSTFRDAAGVLKGSVVPAFTYKNQGRTRSGPFKITWEYWDPTSNTWAPHLGQVFTNDLAPGQSWSEGGQPADGFIWVIGSYWPKFRVRLDPDNTVAEANESNNILVREFKPAIRPLPTPQPHGHLPPPNTVPVSF
jgi:hypothetical protein